MTALSLPQTIARAEDIPSVNADEAHRLLTTALSRFLILIESLHADDWFKPTACTAWNVHDMVAHQAGGYASGTSYKEMIRQYTSKPQPGQLPEDAINALQVGERKSKTPAELISELKQVGEVAAHNWAYGFNAIKWIATPHPVGGFMSIRHLMWIIHSRDTWMHRMDICRATNRPFEQTREHDGRIVELVVRDVAGKLRKRLNGKAITLTLTGVSGGEWLLGSGESVSGLEMDALDFNIFVSGRYSYQEGMNRAKISGGNPVIQNAFKNLLVLY